MQHGDHGPGQGIAVGLSTLYPLVALGDDAGDECVILRAGSVVAEFCAAHRPVFRTGGIPWETYVQAFLAAGPCPDCVTGWSAHWANSV